MNKQKMRNVTTQTVSIAAGYDKTFDYISNPLTQKEWAVNFIKDIKEVENHLIAITPMGEVSLEIRSDKSTGVIDVVLGGGTPVPTRLIRNEGGCVYIFTLFQPAGMPDIAWEQAGIPGLKEELETLKSILEGAE